MDTFFALLPFVVMVAGAATLAMRKRWSGKARKRTGQPATAPGKAPAPGFKSVYDEAGRPSWVGEIDGVEVRVRVLFSGTGSGGSQQNQYWRIVTYVGGGLQLPTDFSLGAEGVVPSSRDFQTGDAEFDGIVKVEGDPVEMTARLDVVTRGAIRRALMQDDFRVVNGEVTHTILNASLKSWDPKEQGWVQSVQGMVAFARALSGDTNDRLEANARGATTLALRRRSLEYLLAREGRSPRVQSLVQSLATEEDKGIGVAAAAVQVPDPAALRRLNSAIRTGTYADEIWRIAVRAVRHHQIEGCLEALTERLQEMEHLEEQDQVLLLEAMAEVGGREHVAALLPHTKGLFGNSAVKAAASVAVAQIQSRLGDPAAGRLTVVAPELDAGALSLPGEAGGMALVDESQADLEEA